MSFSNWGEIELGGIVETIIDYRGKTPKKLGGDWVEKGYRALSAKNIKTGVVVQKDQIRYVNEDLYKKWMKEEIKRSDILLTSEAPFGEVYYWNSDEKIVLSQRLFGIRIKNNISSRYVYYYMTSNDFQKELDGRATGTTVRGLRQPELLKCRISIPPLRDQIVIANMLSSIDDKIEVNNRINKTLENMAQEIFKRWFVDFEFPNDDGEPYKSSGGEMVESELGLIPKGWKVRKIENVIDYVRDSTKSGQHLEGRKYNPIDTLPIRSIAILEENSFEDAKSSLVLFSKYDILIGAMRVYFHRVSIAPYEGITRTTTFVLRSKEYIDIAYNLFLLNQDETIDFASSTSKGSTMPYAIWENGLGEFKVAYPTIEIREKYSNLIMSLIEDIFQRTKQIKLLRDVRDELLPKLMSGEIRVPLKES